VKQEGNKKGILGEEEKEKERQKIDVRGEGENYKLICYLAFLCPTYFLSFCVFFVEYLPKSNIFFST
jgi:hypothetical protein